MKITKWFTLEEFSYGDGWICQWCRYHNPDRNYIKCANCGRNM